MKKLLLFIVLTITTIIGYSQARDICFVHTATSGNINNWWTIIDHPTLNGNLSAKVFITHSLNGDGSVDYNDKTTGVFYNGGQQRWFIYNEDNSPMQISTSFNVYVSGTGAETITAVASGGLYYFVIDDPLLNNKPNLHPVITRVYDSTTGYLNYNYGVYYSGSNKWGIYSEDGSVIPNGATFFLMAEPSDVGYNIDVSYTHTATAANQSGSNGTELDHPLLNNNPEATFVTTHSWGTFGPSDHTFNTYYHPSDQRWTINAEDPPLSYAGETFHVAISLPLPVNNLCTGATPLAVGTSFNDHDIESTLLGSDGDYFGGVWFSATVPVTGLLTIETAQASGSPMHDTWMAVYSGNCSTLTFIASDDNGGTGNFAKVNLAGLTPGETLYILIEEDADSIDPTGPFLISAYDTTLGIAEAIIDGFKMYPNPVENTLQLSAVNTIDALSVYNMLGQEVLQSTPSTTEVALDMSTLPTGTYIVKVQAGEQIGSYSLIKE